MARRLQPSVCFINVFAQFYSRKNTTIFFIQIQFCLYVSLILLNKSYPITILAFIISTFR